MRGHLKLIHHASIGSWLLRLVAWDGLLPVVIWSSPFLIALLLPNKRGAIELTAIVLPIAALFLRFRAGRRYIAANHCGPILRSLQIGVFCLGILVLFAVDAVMILTHVMPKGAMFATTDDLVVWAVLYAIYFTAMAFAMYPGLRQASGTRSQPGNPDLRQNPR